MTQPARYPVGLAAVAILVAAAIQPAQAQTIVTCPAGFSTSSQVVTLAGTATTSSTAPVDLPGATHSFTPADRCLTVEVSGLVRAVSPNALRLSVVVNGAVTEPPFPRYRDVYTQTTAQDGRSVIFYVDMDEGDKDVKVQFRSVDGSPVSLTRGVIIFRYSEGT